MVMLQWMVFLQLFLTRVARLNSPSQGFKYLLRPALPVDRSAFVIIFFPSLLCFTLLAQQFSFCCVFSSFPSRQWRWSHFERQLHSVSGFSSLSCVAAIYIIRFDPWIWRNMTMMDRRSRALDSLGMPHGFTSRFLRILTSKRRTLNSKKKRTSFFARIDSSRREKKNAKRTITPSSNNDDKLTAKETQQLRPKQQQQPAGAGSKIEAVKEGNASVNSWKRWPTKATTQHRAKATCPNRNKLER